MTYYPAPEWAKKVQVGDQLLYSGHVRIRCPEKWDVPARGTVQTVEQVSFHTSNGTLGFRPVGYSTFSVWFNWRPLEKGKTDISIFKEMLKHIPTTATVDERGKELLGD